MSSIGFVNTECFREAAKYWDKHKRYDDGTPGTLVHKAYWNQEIDRCINGYSSGGIWISGYHYHYLNYCRIQIVEKTYGEVHKSKLRVAKKVGERKEEFPAFWDVDYAYFRSVDIAERGITLEDYKSLPIDLYINEDSLGGGCHIVWLKPRGVGASWKAASMAERNYSGIRHSNTFMLANDSTFLTEDGLWSKYLWFRDWQILHARGLGKGSDFKKDRTKMHMRASREINGVETGFMSEVIGVSLNGDWQKARGKRGKLVLWEEFGKFPNADLAWGVARRSIEEGDTVFGLMVGFGTGGTKDANFDALKKMFYDPLAYNLLFFDNIWSENRQEDSICAMFTPATKSIAFRDKVGNSLTAEAKFFLDSEREVAKRAKDPTTLPRMKAEDPYTPEEAVLVTGGNIFISDGLVQHTKEVEILNLYKDFPTAGRFERVDSKVNFKAGGNKHEPVYYYPNSENEDDLTGCPLVYQVPYHRNGEIPEELYKICVDTYRHDSTTGDSIGAAYVIEQPNNFTPTKGDIIVASYVGRPDRQDEFNQVIFELADWCNGEIAFENDEPGDIIGFAKKHKKTQRLANEFELAYDEKLKTSETSTRQFGMSMASGKENKRKKQGDLFIKNWLYTLRGVKLDGSPIYNYHTIKDLGLLQEFCNYNLEGNFDRISAFRVGMYHQQELEYNETVPKDIRNRTTFDTFLEQYRDNEY